MKLHGACGQWSRFAAGDGRAVRLCGGGEWRRTKKEPEESQGRARQVRGSEAWHEMALPKARGGSSLYKPGEPTERGRPVDEPRGTG